MIFILVFLSGFTHPDLPHPIGGLVDQCEVEPNHNQGFWQARDEESKENELIETPIRKEIDRKSFKTGVEEDERMQSEKLAKKKPSEKYRTTTTKNQEAVSPSVQV